MGKKRCFVFPRLPLRFSQNSMGVEEETGGRFYSPNGADQNSTAAGGGPQKAVFIPAARAKLFPKTVVAGIFDVAHV